jgi:hypothetical protein
VDLSISSRDQNPLENTRATLRSVCHHHRHGIHSHDVLTHGYTHVMSIIITIIIIHPSHMEWVIPTWSCRPVASPEIHKLSHDHPDHITSNTIKSIHVLDYATSVSYCLTGVETTRHTIPSHWSSLQLEIKPKNRHEAYNLAQGLQLNINPTTRHESYNSAQGLQLSMKPTT